MVKTNKTNKTNDWIISDEYKFHESFRFFFKFDYKSKSNNEVHWYRRFFKELFIDDFWGTHII